MKDIDISNELKILALEAINNAGSGHSGSVLSCGDVLYTLYTKHLVGDGSKNPHRDRFVLSNGHACAIMYSIFAGLKYFPISKLKTFRQNEAYLAGHPEISTKGVDCNTGPLGQGIANAVGMAIAETMMDARFNQSNYTYCMVGDGCMEEGVCQEALSIAGLYKLNKLIVLYDKNNITLDGTLNQSSCDNIQQKMEAMGFNVLEGDGHNLTEINKLINLAKKSKDKPTMIIFNTIIGKDTKLENNNLSHGKVYTKDEISELRKKLKVKSPYMDLSAEAKAKLNEYAHEAKAKLLKREQDFNTSLINSNKLEKYQQFIGKPKYKVDIIKNEMSTRNANGKALTQIAKTVDNLAVLIADVSNSTKVKIAEEDNYSPTNRGGRNIPVGVREHGMGAIANGIALYGGFRVITSTYLTFSNYMLPSMRMACIMKLPVMFTFSHSSVYDSPDGITHLPVEQLDQLRLIPNMTVCRPANSAEIKTCYDWFFANTNPMCLMLSRGDLPYFDINKDAKKGAYFLDYSASGINILSSGSEVRFANQVREQLMGKINVNVASVISLEIFEKQPEKYKAEFYALPTFVVESGTCVKYYKYVPSTHIFNVNEFGCSGDEASLRMRFGFDSKQITEKILKTLNLHV